MNEWEDWFEMKLRAAGVSWQESQTDYQQYSPYDYLCEKLLKEAEVRWRLKYDQPPRYQVLMRSLVNAQLRIDQRPWDGTKIYFYRVKRFVRRLFNPLY